MVVYIVVGLVVFLTLLYVFLMIVFPEWVGISRDPEAKHKSRVKNKKEQNSLDEF